MAKAKPKDHEAASGDVVVQLATRVPKTLYRELKLHSVEESISISDLVAEALTDVLVKRGGKRKKSAA